MKLVDLAENFLARFQSRDRMGTYVNGDLYKNPNRRELNYVRSTFSVQGSDVPGFIDPSNGDLYIWTPYLLHNNIIETRKVPNNLIAIRMYYEANECEVMVTDTTKHSTYHHNPEMADIIEDSYLSKLFSDIGIRYYDEDIVGDWKNIKKGA